MKLNRKKLDELFMMECISLARKGDGYVSSNPMVGAVLVKGGKVIGRGYHKRFGGAHAEVEAIQNAKTSLRGATIYVNLEPCNYFGKTPACTDLIIRNGIAKVIIGCKDPNPLVAGKGIQQLKKAGIKVYTGVLEDECKKLNESFSKYIVSSLPFVALKIAQTLDGKIAGQRDESRWITNQASRKFVHHLRSRFDAVLVGAGTVEKDNPKLTVRDVKGRNPLRIVIDGNFSTNPDSKIYSQVDAKTILFTSKNSVRKQKKKKRTLGQKGVEIIELAAYRNGNLSLMKVLLELASRGIASVLVEGGAKIFSSFLQEKLADKLFIFIAPKIFGAGLNAFENLLHHSTKNHIRLKNISVINIGDNLLIEAYKK